MSQEQLLAEIERLKEELMHSECALQSAKDFIAEIRNLVKS